MREPVYYGDSVEVAFDWIGRFQATREMLQSLDAASAERERERMREMLAKHYRGEWGVVRLTRMDRHRALPPRSAMKKSVLFIHGAGTGAYAEDRLLADSLQQALGGNYDVQCPQMPDEENSPYPAWKAEIDSRLAATTGSVALGRPFGRRFGVVEVLVRTAIAAALL